MKPPAASPEFFSPRVVEARRFYLDLNPPPSQRLVVVCGGVERVSADYSIHRLSFPFFAIEYVARGQGKLKLRGRKHPLNPGAVSRTQRPSLAVVEIPSLEVTHVPL